MPTKFTASDSSPDATAGYPSAPDAVEFTSNITHELGPDLTSAPVERLLRIPPSKRSTLIRVRSTVAAGPAQRMRSPEYVATIRRRKSQAIREQLEALSRHTGRDDFYMAVHPIVERIRDAISYLLDFETEGNSREILRQLRDSMLDGNWDKYQVPEVRAVALGMISMLADKPEITAKDAFSTVDAFANFGINGPGAILSDVIEG